MLPDDPLWSARAFIYERFAATARAPSAGDVAERFGLSAAAAEDVLRALHDRHALFLEPGSTRIRMANPFSAVETQYETVVAGRRYSANCAWDCFGVASALHATEADIYGICAATGAPIHVRLAGGEVQADSAVVHFLLPFAHWYDDLVHT